MKISVSGAEKADAMLAGLGSDLSAAVAKAAEAVAEEAKRSCPVDTGALRSSIGVSSKDMSAQISAEADYAAFVEFGTYRTAAQPFLVPALINSADAVVDIIRDAISG